MRGSADCPAKTAWLDKKVGITFVFLREAGFGPSRSGNQEKQYQEPHEPPPRSILTSAFFDPLSSHLQPQTSHRFNLSRRRASEARSSL